MPFSFSLPPDDLPPFKWLDADLLEEFDEKASQHFYQACDASVQALLSDCGWRLTSQGNALRLNILCPSQHKNWEVLKKLPDFSYYLSKFSEKAQICIYPPPNQGSPWNVRVKDAISFV